MLGFRSPRCRCAPAFIAGVLALGLATAGCAQEDDPTAPANANATRFPSPTGTKPAQLIRVTDGDTIVLTEIGKTRLIGVDTPEVFGGAECYGREASAFANRLLHAGDRVRYRLGIDPEDRYGRALAYVWLDDGRMLNGLLVELGYAVPLTIPPNVEFAELFVRAARRARRGGRGLWDSRTCAGDDDLPLR
jgi:micrococcal nuclease